MNGRGRTPKRGSSGGGAVNRINNTPASRPAQADAGPRPLSVRQRAALEKEVGGTAAAAAAAAGSPTRPAGDWREVSPSRRRVRDGDTTYRRVAVRNRRRINYPRLLLGWASGALLAEAISLLLFSPRLWVREVRVEGNTSIPSARLLSHIIIGKEQNIVRLPVGKLQKALFAAEPAVETAEIRRVLPGTVHVLVTERKPWASVKMAAGLCYTIDEKLVPFRKTGVPEAGLPLLTLGVSEDDKTTSVTMGKPLSAPGLSEVSKCLQWATSRTDFPLDAVEIDPQGKLCLNRVGGMKVLLGSGMDLDKKLSSLQMLLDKHPGLRDGAGVAYINLFAWDAPAVMPAKPETSATPSAVATNNALSPPTLLQPDTEQP